MASESSFRLGGIMKPWLFYKCGKEVLKLQFPFDIICRELFNNAILWALNLYILQGMKFLKLDFLPDSNPLYYVIEPMQEPYHFAVT